MKRKRLNGMVRCATVLTFSAGAASAQQISTDLTDLTTGVVVTDFTGSTANNTASSGIPTPIHGSVGAVVLNLQNTGDGTTTAAPTNAVTEFTNLDVAVDGTGVDGSVSAITGNNVSALAAGNLGTNSINFDDNGAVTGASLIGNQQDVNATSTVTAEIEENDPAVSATVTFLNGDLEAGAVAAVTSNEVVATGLGNEAINVIQGDFSLADLSLTTPTDDVVFDDGAADITDPAALDTATGVTVSADFGISNAQNVGASVDTSVGSVDIIIDADAILGTATIDQNTVTADANANSAFNIMQGDVDADDTSFVIGSLQTAAGTSATAGDTSGSALPNVFLIDANAATSVDDIGGVASISGNTVQADADTNAVDNTASANGIANDVAVVIRSVQVGNGDTSATTSETGFDIAATGSITDGAVASISENTVLASAVVNTASSVSEISGVGDNSVNQLDNYQFVQDGIDVTSATEVTSFSITTSNDGVAGVASISGNSVVADASGNSASNASSTDVIGDVVSVELTNTQTFGGATASEISATNEDVSFLIEPQGDVMEGVASISQNLVTTEASGNDAMNSGFADINGDTASVSVLNTQSVAAGAAIDAASGGDATFFSIAYLDTASAEDIDGVASIDGNVVSSAALGNTAINDAVLNGIGSSSSASIFSEQENLATVSATTTLRSSNSPTAGTSVGILAAGLSGVGSASNNTFSSSAISNNAVNATTLGIAGPTGADNVGSVSNTQLAGGGVSSTTAGAAIQLTFASISGTGVASISGNTVSSRAIGNSAVNSVNVGSIGQ